MTRCLFCLTCDDSPKVWTCNLSQNIQYFASANDFYMSQKCNNSKKDHRRQDIKLSRSWAGAEPELSHPNFFLLMLYVQNVDFQQYNRWNIFVNSEWRSQLNCDNWLLLWLIGYFFPSPPFLTTRCISFSPLKSHIFAICLWSCRIYTADLVLFQSDFFQQK